MVDRSVLLHHLKEDEAHLGARLVDLMEIVMRDGEPRATDFLDPHERQVAEGIVGAVPEMSSRAYGGYKTAERQRLLLFPSYYLTELLPWPIRLLSATGQFGFVQVGHRDFLGSLLAIGIKREKVGDILLTETGCQVVVAAEIADVVLTQWDAVHRVPIRVEEIDPEQLAVAPAQVKEVRATVASLRLDAVASTGFGSSRTRMAREIKGERVKVNWRTVTDPAHPIKEGDTLSIRGRGRVVVAAVTGNTRKGRIGVLLQRYL